MLKTLLNFDKILTIAPFFITAVVQVKTDNRNLILTITDPRGKRIESLRDEQEYRHHFAAFYSGNYQICIQNTNTSSEHRYELSVQTGV